MNTTRRQFLATGITATFMGGVWSETSAAPSKSPNEKLNMGVIGVGNRGQTNVIGVSSENIVALCDVDERYLDERSERHPHAATYHDFRKLLDRTDLDAVMINTPDHTHAHAAVRAMRQGRHVYCEKPLAHSIHETRLMAQVAREQKVVTQTGNQHHNSAGYRRAVAIVQAGSLGAVREVHSWTNHPFWPQGVGRPEPAARPPAHLHWDLWLGPAPERPYHATYHPIGWRGFWDFGTGALGDRGPHLIDPAFAALKLTAPTSVSAKSSPVTVETAPEWSIIRFEFPARDSLPAVTLFWYDGGQLPPESVRGGKRLPDNGTLLIGERAKLFVPELGREPIVIPNDPLEKIGDTPTPNPPATQPSAVDHYQEWIAACKHGTQPSCHFGYGAKLTELCLLGNLALRTGKQIDWDAERGRVTNHDQANQFLSRPYRAGWEL